MLLVGEARFFLEARTYQQTTISKLFFLYKVNFFSHPAWIMTCRCVFQTFWNLTFIGGIIILTVVVDVWYKLHAEKKATQAARRKAMESKEVGA